jgi:hypothetical protein
MNRQSLTGGELLLGIGVAAGAIWAARNPELVAAVVYGAVKISNTKHFRVHDTAKFDEEIVNRWRNLKLTDFKTYVRGLNLTAIEQQRLVTRMNGINREGAGGIDELWKFMSAVTSTSDSSSYSDKQSSGGRRNQRAARRRTKNQLSAVPRLVEPSTHDGRAQEALCSISFVTSHEIEFTSLPVVDAPLHKSSRADLLRALETNLLAENPPLTRKEVRALLKPVENSVVQRPQPVRQKKARRFEPSKIARLLDKWNEEITRRSGVGLDVIRRTKDRVNIEIPTWTRWVKAEFSEECQDLTGDALKEFTRSVKREVYRLNDRRLVAAETPK